MFCLLFFFTFLYKLIQTQVFEERTLITFYIFLDLSIFLNLQFWSSLISYKWSERHCSVLLCALCIENKHVKFCIHCFYICWQQFWSVFRSPESHMWPIAIFFCPSSFFGRKLLNSLSSFSGVTEPILTKFGMYHLLVKVSTNWAVS